MDPRDCPCRLSSSDLKKSMDTDSPARFLSMGTALGRLLTLVDSFETLQETLRGGFIRAFDLDLWNQPDPSLCSGHGEQ